jgi:hypothetical protein
LGSFKVNPRPLLGPNLKAHPVEATQ